MNAEKLRAALPAGIDLICKTTSTSTNSDGKELCRAPLSRPVLIVADEQTGGRGRQGKTFLSPRGGLYMTLVLPCSLPLEQAVSVTSCAAVAVARALDGIGADCGIKWVNDIYAHGRKLCGILAEAENDYVNGRTNALIIGIGINCSRSPAPLGDVSAVSLAELGCAPDRERLCADIVQRLIEMSESGFDFSAVREEYVNRSIVIGRRIDFTSGGALHHGIARAIGEKGELIVSCGEETIALSSGEISVRVRE